MLTYPTDLTPHEQQAAQARLHEMAGKFTADGDLRTPQWREVFQRTWRHPYVPSYYPEIGAQCLLSIDPQRRGEWLAAVYSDQTLFTKVVQVPLSPALRPGTYPILTSSSTLPSLVLTMLEALDVADGHRVLEIGTGSGYNTALLCERLGGERVTSVDIDPELVELATERLAANGYTPTLTAADGVGGYPPGAPYNRIIVSCSVPAIPPAWLEQAVPGAVIVVDVRGQLGGTVVRLTVDDSGVATGRFLPFGSSFMPLRHTPDIPPSEVIWEPEGERVESLTDVDPTLLHTDGLLGFVAQWHLPEVSRGPLTEDCEPGIHLRAPNGSRASVRSAPTHGRFPVTQYGPRRLWDEVAEAHGFWERAGRPRYDRFGITATTTDQYVWYDHPGSEHRWPLPVSIAP
ncbi:MAG: methyltransferase domain-containing protein [Pseudonocardiaceae bacterium]